MSPQETGKERASRIQLDYYKRPDRLQSVKRAATLAALAPALLWLIGGLVFSKQGQNLYSRGPLASAHAAWDTTCEACHTPFQPLSAENVMHRLSGDAQASEQKCMACHAGPPHHLTQNREDTQTCAGCHRDHQGRDMSLVRVADSTCTHCHANLSQHMSGATKYQNSITAFDADSVHHPEFRSVYAGKDPGNLKFNHKLHLTAGMVRTAGAQPWRLSDIQNEAERNRYARRQNSQEPATPVQLDCASCHQIGAAPASATSSGAYMLPIYYENHCRACHPLTLRRTEADRNQWTIFAVPHGLQPAEVKTFLWGAYAEKISAPVRQRLATHRPLPGQAPFTPTEENAIRRQTAQAVVEADAFLRLDEVKDAEKVLYRGKTTCGECHIYEKEGSRALTPQRIKPTNVPTPWLPSARFSHAAHHALECRACHDHAESSVSHEDVLIPGKAVCVDCHAPAGTVNGKVRGGARFDCTECHRYHHGEDRTALSTGAVNGSRAAPRPGGVEEFLSGALKPASR